MTVKGAWRVTNNDRTTRFGITASSLEELISKSIKRLGIRITRNQIYRCYVADDGTRVTDDAYLFSLKNQTLLILVKQGDMMKKEQEHNISKQFSNTNLSQNIAFEVVQLLKNIPNNNNLDCRANLNSKEEDPEWFKGIKSSVKTKEEHMRSNAKNRIYGYYSKVKTALTKCDMYTDPANHSKREMIDIFIKALQDNLIRNKYHQSYFDKSVPHDKICDRFGTFECKGNWNEEFCNYSHKINPYSNFEQRILFSTWNLDHQVELSRSIIPSIRDSIDNNDCECLDFCYSLVENYYSFLFTIHNLKLVNIVCHDKAKHDTRKVNITTCTVCR